MRRILRALAVFWAVAASGGGLVLGYIGVANAGLLWVFWSVVAVGAIVAVGTLLAPEIRSAAERLRSQPVYKAEAERLKSELATSRESEASTSRRLITAREDGIAEGESRVIGSLRAAQVPVPKIVGIAEVGDEVVLVAQYSGVAFPVGARYSVVSSSTGSIKGLVSAASFDEERSIVYLECVVPTVPRFWEALAEKVIVDDSAPPGIGLERFIYGEQVVSEIPENVITEETQVLEESNG